LWTFYYRAEETGNCNIIKLLPASDFSMIGTTATDIVGFRLTGSRLFGTAARTDVLLLFTEVMQKERENTASHLWFHDTVVASPSQQLVVRLRHGHIDVVELSNHLLLQQRRQNTLDDTFTNFLGHRLQARHYMEYVTDRLSHTLENSINSSVQYSKQ